MYMNSTLYIIGNGFDLANKLPTSYENFRKYLIKKSKESQKEHNNFFVIQKKGKLAPDDFQNATLMIRMIDSALARVYHKKQDWRYFEDILGRLKYEDIWKDESKNAMNGVIIHIAFTRLRDYFKEWILSIDLKQARPINGFPQKSNALFPSFNYTAVLETIYHVLPDNICHVHGVCGDTELIFGHKELEERNFKNETDVERQVAIVREMLLKDTEACYSEHYDFFNRINKQIKEVVSIGFSYADVDMYYIDKIIKNVGNDTIWYLHMYNFKDTMCFKHKIRKCGFRGKIKMFKNIECSNNQWEETDNYWKK